MTVRARSSLLLLCLAASGCGHPVERKLEGRWQGEGVENFPNDKVAAATGWARGVAFDFSGSKLRVTVPAEEPRSAQFGVARAEGADVHLSVKAEGAEEQRLHLKLDDERSLRWMLADGRSIVLRRSS